MSGSPRSPRSPKTLKKKDKITYHPYLEKPEIVVNMTDEDRLRLFQVDPSKLTGSQRRSLQNAISNHIVRNVDPHITPQEFRAKTLLSQDIARRRQTTFRQKNKEANAKRKLDNDIQLVNEGLDKNIRDKRLHDLQAAKEEKTRERDEMLKLWNSDNPAMFGKSETAYTGSAPIPPSPPKSSLFGKLFSWKAKSNTEPEYTPLTKNRASPEDQKSLEEKAKTHAMWTNFRTSQIDYDNEKIARSRNMLAKLKAEHAAYRNKHARTRSRARSGGSRRSRSRSTAIHRKPPITRKYSV
jgi:hypothetical protein